MCGSLQETRWFAKITCVLDWQTTLSRGKESPETEDRRRVLLTLHGPTPASRRESNQGRASKHASPSSTTRPPARAWCSSIPSSRRASRPRGGREAPNPTGRNALIPTRDGIGTFAGGTVTFSQPGATTRGFRARPPRRSPPRGSSSRQESSATVRGAPRSPRASCATARASR